MKPEEAIKILQGRIELTKKVWSNAPEIIEYREALELAVKALQVQIPMKPDNIKSILIFPADTIRQKAIAQFATERDFINQIFIVTSVDRN